MNKIDRKSVIAFLARMTVVMEFHADDYAKERFIVETEKFLAGIGQDDLVEFFAKDLAQLARSESWVYS